MDGVRDIFPGKIGVKIRLQVSKQDTEDGNTSKIHRMELQTSPTDLQQGEVCCPLEWGKIGHQEFQGLLRSLLVSQTWFGDVWRTVDLFPFTKNTVPLIETLTMI